MSDVHYSKIKVPNVTAFKPTLIPVAVEYLVLALTVVAFIYGVTSWCVIKKFRNFRNYVYLSAIVSSLLRLTTVSLVIPGILQIITIDDQQILNICRYICTYFTTVQNYWLLVICYIFYGDIVKVFHDNVRRRFLKSTLFAWGVPFVTFLTYYVYTSVNKHILDQSHDSIANYVEVFIIVSPLAINCIIYTVVVFTLCKCTSKGKPTATNTWRRFYIATLLFVLSDVIVLSSFIWEMLSITVLLRAIMSKLQQIVIDLFLPLVRSNRELWKDFYNHRMSTKSIV